MTKARVIVSNALTFHLNRLAPGETLDPDVAQRCLDALNDIADEFNGQKGFLFREILSAGAVTGATGTLGTNWATLAPGDLIEGATVASGGDLPLRKLSMDRYANIADKATAGLPQTFTPDGYALVYFWPACTGQTVTLRTRQTVSDFADLDTDYGMPKGWRSGLAVLLARKISKSLTGSVSPDLIADAAAARTRLGAQALMPAIIAPAGPAGNVLSGWN
jgi:hypothetical protein